MFTPNPNIGFNPEMGGNMPSQHGTSLESFAFVETPEELIAYEENLIKDALLDMCMQRAQESLSGYSSVYHAKMLARQGIFSDPSKSYEELDRFNRNHSGNR